MPWLQLSLNTIRDNVDAIGDHMLELGALSITLVDAKDNPILEPAPGETPLWNEIQMMMLFDANVDTQSILDQWQNADLYSVEQNEKFELIEDKDWEREWMDRFEPMQFGEKLWICPSWKPVPDKSAVNVILDPGLAFGTGTHPTTALVLSWLDAAEIEGKVVIDYGCGSGILAIAALKLGAQKVYAVDIDEQALIATKENAKRNDVYDDRLVIDYPEILKELQVDIVVANILAGPLVELSEKIASLCKTNGLLAISGILDNQAEPTRAAYQQWFKMERPILKEEWSLIHGQKRNADG